MKTYKNILIIGIVSFGFLIISCSEKKASIKEETMMIETYPFQEPDAVPILSDNSKIFPYFKFKGYSHESSKQPWKVVTLENDYIKLFVLPEIGGKVWGAIEKKTGHEFLYKNKVVKFRNIAMRGPWTSGGIEFNFGIIGHSPATATPVDYEIRNNDDGSVSCFVGNTDLPSNSQWRVEIRLENDKAYFETKASWYNASPLNQSYYNWMTAAAVATNDLEFFIPGNGFLEHSGEAKPWPIDSENRDLSMYRNNNFGPAKSYHIVGDYKDFFGGYYHDRDFGYGHWSPYEEMPGQKLWLWSLARTGGIWEDLLTDTDGQYIEFQAGRLLNQYSPGAVNPISQTNFDPYVMDRWREIWFPFKEIGGMVDASELGVLNVEHENNELYIGVNPLQVLNEDLQVKINGKEVLNERLGLDPMEIYSIVLEASPDDQVEVSVGGKLKYATNDHELLLKRPFSSPENLKMSPSEALYYDGWEAMKFREFDLAHEKLSELIKMDAFHQMGLNRMAELEYRKGNNKNALEYANRSLSIDTYNSGANYMAGIIYRASDDPINALESFGWAARDVKYRSVSYTQMAEIHLSQGSTEQAAYYAHKAIDYNRFNLNARHVLLIVARKNADNSEFNAQYMAIDQIDALDHFKELELHFFNHKGDLNASSISFLHNELPEETALDFGIKYYQFGLIDESISVLKTIQNKTKNKLWLAYVIKDIDPEKSNAILEEVLADPAEFVFPYRRATIPVLEWASKLQPHWKLAYYLAQNYIALGKMDLGKQLLMNVKEESDSDVFYRFRANLADGSDYSSRLKDYQKALELNQENWMVWDDLIRFYLGNKNYSEAYELCEEANNKFINNYNIQLSFAKAALKSKSYEKVIQVLDSIQILPFEHASESRKIFEYAHVLRAIQYLQKNEYSEAVKILTKSKEWPENIGVGKPYNPDERIQNYLLAYCYKKLNDEDLSEQLLQDVVSYTTERIEAQSLNHLLGLLALEELGDKDALEDAIKILEKSEFDKKLTNSYVLALYQGDKVKQSKLKDDLFIGIEQRFIIDNLPMD